MHPTSFSVKEHVAASTQNLTLSALLFLYHEQMSTQVVLSAGIQAWSVVQDTLSECLYDSPQLARPRCASTMTQYPLLLGPHPAVRRW
jgi:hypothetical protein